MDVLGADSSGLFTTPTDQSTLMASYAQRTLIRALDLFSNKRYQEAVTVFKQAIGVAPRSSAAFNAYDYMAKSYLALKDDRHAIDAYQKSLRQFPDQSATYISLGTIYYDANNYAGAEAAYAKAVKLDPSANNRYALGQALLQLGRYDEAAQQFSQIKTQSLNRADQTNGEFGLAQVYAKQGKYSDAIHAFKRVIDAQPDQWYAYQDLGFAYADQGNFDAAKKMVAALTPKAADLAASLSTYITSKMPPAMSAVLGTSTFLYTLGPGTKVASLGSYLTDPGSQQTFTMEFQFSKDMDAQSVENVNNWSISRSLDTGKADGYNFSLAIPSTEVSLPKNPSSVSYDAEKGIAKVYFSIQQNAAGNGTIDPFHVKFKFQGVDSNGLAMNSQADEYTGFSDFA